VGRWHDILEANALQERVKIEMHDHAWLRLLPLWYGIFYVMLALSTVLALLDASPRSVEAYAAILGLSTLLACWYAACIVPRFQHIRYRPLIALIYLAVGWGLWFWITLYHPIYQFLLFGLYPQIFFFRSLPWKIFDAIILTILSIAQQVLLLNGFDATLLITLAAAISGILMTFFIEAIIRQSRERHRLLQELAMTRHELALAERRAGVMGERQRLAREIHDTLVQGFASIVMHLEAADEMLPSEMQTLQKHLDQARRTARENLLEARRLMWALQPKVLDHAQLPEVLIHLAEQWSQEYHVAASVAITGASCPLRPEIEVILLRATQEALTNIGKHASASMVTVTLSYMEDEIALDVLDDGCGFDLEALPTSHPATNCFGLQALRTRVEQAGGTLSVESTPGEGTTIVVALPLMNPLLSIIEVER
jgi:signal transduction histidine kinase